MQNLAGSRNLQTSLRNSRSQTQQNRKIYNRGGETPENLKIRHDETLLFKWNRKPHFVKHPSVEGLFFNCFIIKD